MVRVSRVTALVALTSSVLVAYGAACSSSTAGGGPNDEPSHGGTDASSPSPGKDGSAGGSDAGAGQDAAPADEASTGNPCAKLSGDKCGSCCEDNHKSGADVFYNALFGCLCGPQGKCQTQCEQTDCSDQQDAGLPQPGDPCDQCEMTNAPDDGGGACGPSINTACTGSPDCKALLDCWDQCP